MYNTGENEQDLRKILDLTRLISIVLLLLHFYYNCYGVFDELGLSTKFSDKIIVFIIRTGLLKNFFTSKIFALNFLLISMLGARGRKEPKVTSKAAWIRISIGLAIYFGSGLLFECGLDNETITFSYISSTLTGYLIVLNGGVHLSRVIRKKLKDDDIFNKENETFPQEERLIENEGSVNIAGRYKFRGNWRPMYINYVNLARGLLICGSPGSGKTTAFIYPILKQCLQKGYTVFTYDFKFPDLSIIAYNYFLANKNRFEVEPKFYVINFDDLTRCHRCNPLDPQWMDDISDAVESARTILLGLNRDWLRKQGDFWVESAVNFFTGIIWFLRRYEHGRYCTLPHAIELMLLEYDKLFPILGTEPEISAYIKPFVSAHKKAPEQLEGQVGGTLIAIARLSSPRLYYVLTGNDFTLDLNNPREPKIFCAGNNPMKQQIYGPVLSLFVSRMNKLVNQPGKLRCCKIYDEFPTIVVINIDQIAIERSNKCNTVIVVQDISQLRKNYGREEADAILNIAGNIATGQAIGDTAKFFSDQFGKIMQDRESISIQTTEVSISQSKQLELAIPPSTIAKLSSGEFVGIVADNPDQQIELKAFHAKVSTDYAALTREKTNYKPLPLVRKKVDQGMIDRNYEQVKRDVQNIQEAVFRKIINDPSLHHLLNKKSQPSAGNPGNS